MSFKKFNKICNDIKKVKIQGAENIAKAVLEALKIKNDKNAIKKLISLRPTEPAVRNTIAKILEKIEKGLSWEKAIEEMKEYFEISDKKICEYGERIIENNSIIYTHCHSSTVEKTLKFAKKLGKNFTVYITETRPLFQGRITAENLAKAGIKVVLGVDSNAFNFLKKADMFLFGADAITSEGDIINKIGTAMFTEIAQKLNVPCYCLSLSIKYDPITRYGYQEEIEQRPAKEIWNKKIKNLKIVNPAFEIVKAKNINAIISEYGILAPTAFVEIANKEFDIKKLTSLKNGLWRI
ncbi:MAG: translation initiation factor eIF-2B [Candidatus Pacearchaeota archaeon]